MLPHTLPAPLLAFLRIDLVLRQNPLSNLHWKGMHPSWHQNDVSKQYKPSRVLQESKLYFYFFARIKSILLECNVEVALARYTARSIYIPQLM